MYSTYRYMHTYINLYISISCYIIQIYYDHQSTAIFNKPHKKKKKKNPWNPNKINMNFPSQAPSNQVAALATLAPRPVVPLPRGSLGHAEIHLGVVIRQLDPPKWGLPMRKAPVLIEDFWRSSILERPNLWKKPLKTGLEPEKNQLLSGMN